MSMAPLFMGGVPLTLVNSIGRPNQLGYGLSSPINAPAIVLDRPAGLNIPFTFTLQRFVRDDGSAGEAPFSVTNAVVIAVR